MGIYLDIILTFLKNELVWTVLSSVSSFIAAIVVIIAVYNSRREWQVERESRRPFFIIEEPGIKTLPESPPYRMQITMENRGMHLASELEGMILILKADLTEQPDFDIRFSIANAIPSNTPTPWYDDNVQLPKNMPHMYIIFVIKYKDFILETDHHQTFFMKWDGIQDGITRPDFIHISTVKAKEIVSFLKEELNDFVQEYSL